MRNKHELIAGGADNSYAGEDVPTQDQIEQKTRELKDLVGFNEETGKAERWDELSEGDRERVDVLKQEVETLKEKEKEFNPEREKEKLVRWAEENLGKSIEEAEEFIDQNFTIDTDNERIVVEEDINFRPFAGTLKEIPDNVTFEGEADFFDCRSLEEIGDNVTFEGRANFTNCESLKEIPENITFEGKAYFTDCTFLEKIGDNVTFGGDTSFAGCISLEKIPDNVTFGGFADFANCTSLENIGDNIIFGDNADFRDCSLTQESIEKLKKMKEDGKIGGRLELP